MIIRALAARYTIEHVEAIIPDPFDPLFRELLFAPELGRASDWIARLVAPFLRHGRELELVRMVARVIRNLAVGELVVAGDLGDRGPRIDKVIELLEQQPDVAITFGNHDCDWIAACLGQPAAVATVVRLTLRYGRSSQLEEGYGISLDPLRQLAKVYTDDPATQFMAKGSTDGAIARMQKAISIVQLKLEGELFQRHPEWQLEHRAVLHRVDLERKTVALYGTTYPLLDAYLPTLDPRAPYTLSPAEQACIDALVHEFTASPALWRQIQFVARHGKMYLRRDRCAIFHGCMPVDAAGNFLPLVVDGEPRAGRPLFDALERVIQRAIRKRDPDDVDLVFYLWTGPLSPCFGKDKMATFETYFVADKATHAEHKNPYFSLIHDAAFCGKVLAEFGVDPARGYLINGHVPVKLEAGEQPIKRSHRAITIDGAFAAAYGDKGFSLVLGCESHVSRTAPSLRRRRCRRAPRRRHRADGRRGRGLRSTADGRRHRKGRRAPRGDRGARAARARVRGQPGSGNGRPCMTTLLDQLSKMTVAVVRHRRPQVDREVQATRRDDEPVADHGGGADARVRRHRRRRAALG